MTQKEKELLLKDLCERLLYGVQVFVERDKYAQATLFGVNTNQFSVIFGGNGWSSTSNIEGHHIEQYKQLVKPYLRPMSSMTEEEDREWQVYKNNIACSCDKNLNERVNELHDWFNKKGFDYRGLIPMGLALEAPEDMYKI